MHETKKYFIFAECSRKPITAQHAPLFHLFARLYKGLYNLHFGVHRTSVNKLLLAISLEPPEYWVHMGPHNVHSEPTQLGLILAPLLLSFIQKNSSNKENHKQQKKNGKQQSSTSTAGWSTTLKHECIHTSWWKTTKDKSTLTPPCCVASHIH